FSNGESSCNLFTTTETTNRIHKRACERPIRANAHPAGYRQSHGQEKGGIDAMHEADEPASLHGRWLRPSGGHAGEVQPVELFFDLVYALAVTQLTHH